MICLSIHFDFVNFLNYLLLNLFSKLIYKMTNKTFICCQNLIFYSDLLDNINKNILIMFPK